MEAFIDCKNLHDAIYSTTICWRKHLRIDVASNKEMLASDGICQVNLVPSHNHLQCKERCIFEETDGNNKVWFICMIPNSEVYTEF